MVSLILVFFVVVFWVMWKVFMLVMFDWLNWVMCGMFS